MLAVGYFPLVITIDLCLLINYEQISSGHGWLQNSSTRFIKTCGADFKYHEVADLRLRTKLLNVQLRTRGCELRTLKFGCRFAVCELKRLAVPSTAGKCTFGEIYIRDNVHLAKCTFGEMSFLEGVFWRDVQDPSFFILRDFLSVLNLQPLKKFKLENENYCIFLHEFVFFDVRW